jgi:hypothetical protein
MQWEDPIRGNSYMRGILGKLGSVRLFRAGLGRDVSLALILKLVLLTALIAVISYRAVRPPNTAAATAAAVAGISSDGAQH